MPTQNTNLDDYFWPERAEPNDEVRTVVALLSFIRCGFSDGSQALAKAAAQDAGVPVSYALSLLQRHTGSGSLKDHFWEVRHGQGRCLQYRLLSLV